MRELARGGQVYYVYNRVSDIAEMAARDRRSWCRMPMWPLPTGRCRSGSWKRSCMTLSTGMIDVLVSTTIIETGLDISNVNTMIIHDADNMGLSQLYQLRGRVGRSNRTAYAFLMYRRDKMLKGSGGEASCRPSGNLQIWAAASRLPCGIWRSVEQEIFWERSSHGHMEAVGYDLYCKMLNECSAGVKREQRGTGDVRDDNRSGHRCLYSRYLYSQ